MLIMSQQESREGNYAPGPLPDSQAVPEFINALDAFLKSGKKFEPTPIQPTLPLPVVESTSATVDQSLLRVRDFYMDMFLVNHVNVNAGKTIREEVQDFYHAFPVWRNALIQIYQNPESDEEKLRLQAAQQITLSDLSRYSQDKFERLVKESENLIPESPQQIMVQRESSIWERISTIAKGAAELKEV